MNLNRMPIKHKSRKKEDQYTLVPIPHNTNMVVNNHNLDVTIPLFLARVDWPTHIFAYFKINIEL